MKADHAALIALLREAATNGDQVPALIEKTQRHLGPYMWHKMEFLRSWSAAFDIPLASLVKIDEWTELGQGGLKEIEINALLMPFISQKVGRTYSPPPPVKIVPSKPIRRLPCGLDDTAKAGRILMLCLARSQVIDDVEAIRECWRLFQIYGLGLRMEPEQVRELLQHLKSAGDGDLPFTLSARDDIRFDSLDGRVHLTGKPGVTASCPQPIFLKELKLLLGEFDKQVSTRLPSGANESTYLLSLLACHQHQQYRVAEPLTTNGDVWGWERLHSHAMLSPAQLPQLIELIQAGRDFESGPFAIKFTEDVSSLLITLSLEKINFSKSWLLDQLQELMRRYQAALASGVSLESGLLTLIGTTPEARRKLLTALGKSQQIDSRVQKAWDLLRIYFFNDRADLSQVAEIVEVFDKAINKGIEWAGVGWDAIGLENHDGLIFVGGPQIEESGPQDVLLDEMKMLLVRYLRAIVQPSP